ncbi:Reelin domain-containing protein [Trichostrongylus colubriformis]|uniref:Reelin domain-containing protein n=1 Tax=Trichostrongylus colubriformis TaxID=6319 RepID=A0AAN8FV97_TRICO
MILLFYATLIQEVLSWPDGAPCLHAAYESMNPLEAVEHQGGLQLTPPPYEVKVDQKCYWRNQPVTLHLQGLNESVWYKGFVIQPFEWNNGQLGQRMGQLMRLDDNGSWQQQCFRFKNSATHSHDEKKKHIRLWWKIDEDSRTVQFVATVVKHQTMFWVKSVLSPPIPPCRVSKNGIENYQKPLPTPPPPVKQFKMDTNRAFGGAALPSATSPPAPPPAPASVAVPVDSRTNNLVQETFQPQAPFAESPQPQPQSSFLPSQPNLQTSFAQSQTPFNQRQSPTPFTPQPATFTQATEPAMTRMKQIIPLTDGFGSRPPTVETTTDFSVPSTTRAIFINRVSQTRQQSHQGTFSQPGTLRPSFTMLRRPQQTTFSSFNPIRTSNGGFPIRTPTGNQRLLATAQVCFDRDGADRCHDWVPYCRSERFFAYMRAYCTRSCGFC